MKVYIASDHAGYRLKDFISKFLVMKNIAVEDLGPESEESVDYSDFAKKLCEAVLGSEDKGILICGTGIGMSMSANRVPGIRAALCFNTTMAHFAKAHNDANVLCLGDRIIGKEVAKDIVDVFLNVEFEYGRHKRRVEKIESMKEIGAFVCSNQNIDAKNQLLDQDTY